MHSLVSPLEVKVREPAICATCHSHDCIRGNDRLRGCELQLFQPGKLGNFDCTFCLECVQACPTQNIGILRVLPGQSLREERAGSGIGRLNRRADVAALVLILVFGAFVNAAGMTEPVMRWMHRWLGLPILTVSYACGLLIVPGLLATACGLVSWRFARTDLTWKDLTCSFSLALVPVGFGMWLAHFTKHLIARWYWLPGLELTFLGLGLLLTLYTMWRVASRLASGDRLALAMMSPWAVLAATLYSTGIWIVFQPMQMRGMMMR